MRSFTPFGWFLEKLVHDFGHILKEILRAHPTVRMMIQRPMYRSIPPQYKTDLKILQVGFWDGDWKWVIWRLITV